jgi:CRISPR-associated endonuclease Cas1
MPQHPNPTPETRPSLSLTEVFDRTPRDPTVVVADGYGLRIHVERGHLVIADGIGTHRRLRHFARVERTVRRLLILGHTGGITLDALAWCHAVGISVTQLDPKTGEVLMAVGSTGRDDPRLRRAQAFAATRPVGLAITQGLIGEKITVQANVLRRLDEGKAADALDGRASRVAEASELRRVAEIEAQAANTYYAAWTRHVQPTFAKRDLPRVPEHWLDFDGRRSVLDYGRSPRKAAAPVNAILNYCYALAEAECRIALVAVGLDAGLGILHRDKLGRDSLALDIVEPIRPLVDGTVLALLERRRFRVADFHQTPDGHCRILAPLTHDLAEVVRSWLPNIGRVAEFVAHSLANDSAAPIPLRTPLTGSNHRAATVKVSGRRSRKQAPAAAAPARTCRDCGAALATTARELCAGCWPNTRGRLAVTRAGAGVASIALSRALGHDPTATPKAQAKRSAALAARKSEQLAWESSHQKVGTFDAETCAALAKVPLSRIQAATGLSLTAASRIRSGKLIPHARHWASLAALSRSPRDE